MKKTLNILIVEDSEDDALLVLHRIKKGGYNFEFERVDTFEKMQLALTQKTWDIILSDYAMPNFSGSNALKLLKKTGIDIPFIIISGTIGEEVAVEMMKAGANDYIMKNNMQRLLPAVERELHESENRAKRRFAEEALRESEQQYRSLAENVPDSIVRYDKNCRTIYSNKNLEKTLNTSFIEIINLRPTEFQSDGRFDNYEKNLKEVIASGKELEFEQIDYDINGKERYSLIKIVPERNEVNEIIGALAINRDITQRKRAEMITLVLYKIANAVITSKNITNLFDFIKNELNTIIDAKNLFVAFVNKETGMLSSIVHKDEKDDITEWPAEKSLTGYVIKQNKPILLRKKDIIRLHEEGIVEFIGTTAEAWLGVPLKIEGNVHGAIVVQSYDKPDIYDQSSIEILELVAHELSIFIDWRRAEEKAIRLFRAVEQSSVSVVITNKEGDIEYVNPFFTKLTNYGSEEVIGKNTRVLKSGYHPKAYYNELWNTILTGKDWEGEIFNKKKNGDLYWEKVVISPIVDGEGIITNFVAIKEDITERIKMIEELVAAKEKAEESDKLKSAFLANMSHEIRTPMNGILGFASLLKKPELAGERQQEYISYIEQSGERMLSIINDIVCISKIESGTMDIHLTEMNVNNQLEFVYNSMELEAKGKDLTLSCSCSLTDKEAVIITDSEKFYGILTNLIKNAIKYTHKGTIEFGYNLNTANEVSMLEFFIKDTGIGIHKDRQQAIFERFIQADMEDEMVRQGAGLGLAIAKAYVEMLEGKIWVESEPKYGSTFFFTIPYNTEVKEKSVNQILVSNNDDLIQPRIFKVLIVEDDEISEALVKEILNNLTNKIITAKNGLEAINLCRKNPDIDLILMDIQMPEMNGYHATQQIRQFNKEVIIIAHTAFALSGDKEKAINAGCTDYISKPINRQKLNEIIFKHLNNK